MACPGSSPGWQTVANGSGDVLTLRSDGLASRFNLLPGGRNPSQGGVKIRVAAAGRALYIATNGNGLFCLDPARGAMPSRVEEPAGTDALSDMLLCIMATGDGTLLVGNEAAGVTCVMPGRQTQARYILPEPGGMGSLANTVRHIATRGDGKMFVSTKDNAIYDYNPATGGLQATGRLRACAYAFFTDRHGHTYLGTRGDGLNVDGLRYATDETARHIPSNDIYDVAQDGRGRIYVATWDGGLLVADNPGQRPVRFWVMLNRTRDERRVRRVCIDGRGRAWVATCNGLYTADTRQGRIDNASFTRLAAADGSLPATNIICLTVARDGNVYAGGLGCGLIKVKPGKGAARPGYEQITMAQGLVNDNVRSVVEDRYGYIWTGTEEGVSRVNPSNNTATSYRFGTTLEGNICSEGAAAVAPDGTLLFGTFGGMLAVSPVNPERDMTRARPPLITNIMVNGLEPWQDTALAGLVAGADTTGRMELGHDQGNITLCFSNMDYANAESSFFMYRLDGRKVLISVEDSGPGLSEEQQKSLFSPFMHGYVGSGGMGIGLYTARQMALLHKGDLTYGRAAGLTVFTVELPADESVYAAGDYGAEPSADETGTPGAGGGVRELLPEPLNDVKVAIVEDDPDMMEQLRTEIGAYFRTECYPDGESAADGLAASGVALVVCDVMLPGIDGYELVRRLRHNAATASVPVIMLTALDDDEHALRGYKAGADDYMGKPCNFALLAAKAARLIAWRSHGRAESAGGQPEGQGGVVTARADRAFMDSVRRVVEARLGEPGFGVDQLADAM